jgi:ubiquinone/menaquinone biosynthesis C-methylase UbiE
MTTDEQQRLEAAFRANGTYFAMMSRFHEQHGGVAVEENVKEIIGRHCRDDAAILEAGCGEGSITKWFASHYPNARFTGIDISPIGVALAAQSAPPNSRFLEGDVTALDYPANSLDFVFSHSVIEHVPHWTMFVSEAHRVLKPRGRLLIRVANAGVRGVSRKQALIQYVMHRNTAIDQHPSLALEAGNLAQHQENFDAVEIPSDVLVAEMKRAGFRISYFSTRTESWRNSPRLLVRLAYHLNVWPISHLGSVTVVLGEK